MKRMKLDLVPVDVETQTQMNESAEFDTKLAKSTKNQKKSTKPRRTTRVVLEEASWKRRKRR